MTGEFKRSRRADRRAAIRRLPPAEIPAHWAQDPTLARALKEPEPGPEPKAKPAPVRESAPRVRRR